MDGSNGVPPAATDTNTPPPSSASNNNIVTAIRFLSIDPLFAHPPAHNNSLLLPSMLNVQPIHHNDALLNLMTIAEFQSQLTNLINATATADTSGGDVSITSTMDASGSQVAADISDSTVHVLDASSNLTAADASDTTTTTEPSVIPWSERSLTPPPKGTIRLISPPPVTECESLLGLWDIDRTITQWVELAAVNEQAAGVFAANQRERWLAWKVWYRLTQRIWRRRTQCNVDMIEMAPVPDADAILITDTTHHMIYRFHRHDLFNTLLSNICMSDEMLPNPREPRNPWTNAAFTYGQIVGVCQALLQDYARRGRCPPVLFSAFWAARFDVRRFATENASLLSQHAINAYFKDITDHNRDTIADTIQTLLAEAGVSLVPVHVRRWLRVTPLTDGHKAWLAFARDYTLYMNLHVQVRPHWHSEEMVYRDVRRLYQRHPITDNAGPRVRALRDMRATPGPGMAAHDPAVNNLLSLLLGPSNGTGSLDEMFGNIQNSLFGGRGSGGRG